MINITIMDAKSQKNHLENLRNYWLDKKQMKIASMMPSSPNLDKVNVDGGTRQDKFLNYVVAIDEIDTEIDNIDNELKLIEEYIENELKRLDEYNEWEQKVIYYRESGMTWFQIACKTPFSERTCRRIYKRYKMKRSVDDESR